jgi:transcriptional regulator with XRE-family HTH domain
MKNLWLKQRLVIREKLERLLIERGRAFTYSEAADLLGTSVGKVAGWFGPRMHRPNADELQAIGELLGLSAEWLLYGRGEPERKSVAHCDVDSIEIPDSVHKPAMQAIEILKNDNPFASALRDTLAALSILKKVQTSGAQ